MEQMVRCRHGRLSGVFILAVCWAAVNAVAAGPFPPKTPEPTLGDRTGLIVSEGLVESNVAIEHNSVAESGPAATPSFADQIADPAEGSVSQNRADPDPTLLDRFNKLESEWEAYRAEQEEAAEAKKKKPSYRLNGRIHLDQWNFLESDPGINRIENGDPTQDPQDRWDFRRIRLTWTGQAPGNMVYRTMIDFNNPSNPEMKDVYFGFDQLPHNQKLLIGNQKRPLGMDHLNSSRHNVFIERPLAVETFNEDARRTGICMYGFTDDDAVNWQYGAFLLENMSGDGRYRGDFDEAGLYGRVAASPWYDEISGGRGYYHCAIAGSVNQTDGDGNLDRDTNANEARFRTRPLARSSSRWWNTGRILGADGYQQLAFESALNVGSFQLTGEYINTWLQRDPLGGFAGDDLHFHGGYLFANYFLTGEHIPLSRRKGIIGRVKPFENFFVVDRCTGGTGRGWGALSLGVRGDYLDLVDSDIQGGRGYAVTFSSNWYWTAYSKLQTNLILGEIENAGEGRFPDPSLAGLDGDFTIVGFRYMIDF
jgi:phosphate-selective porin OprO/OprP